MSSHHESRLGGRTSRLHERPANFQEHAKPNFFHEMCAADVWPLELSVGWSPGLPKEDNVNRLVPTALTPPSCFLCLALYAGPLSNEHGKEAPGLGCQFLIVQQSRVYHQLNTTTHTFRSACAWLGEDTQHIDP